MVKTPHLLALGLREERCRVREDLDGLLRLFRLEPGVESTQRLPQEQTLEEE